MARSSNIYGSDDQGIANRASAKALNPASVKDDVWGPVRDKRANQGSNVQKYDQDVKEGVPKQNSADKRFTKGN